MTVGNRIIMVHLDLLNEGGKTCIYALKNVQNDNYQSVCIGLPLLEARFHFLFYIFMYYRFLFSFLQKACIISLHKKLNEGVKFI